MSVAPHAALSHSSPSMQATPSSHDQELKIQQILKACAENDTHIVRDCAASTGGLIKDDIRRVAWPLLLGYDTSSKPESAADDWKSFTRHRDEDQVELDVNRSFVYYPTNESDAQRTVRKRELSDIITAVLRRHPLLCYFQGYHDIVQVLLLVLGVDRAAPAVARLSLLRIRDFMLPTLAGTESHLHLLPAILYSADTPLYQHLTGATKPTPFFALAATLTLYAHDVEEYGDIARLFDFLLASEAAVPVYLFATIVMARKTELLDIPSDEPEMLHSILSKLPKPLDLEGLISRTCALFRRYPPERLPNRTWQRSLQDGEHFFELQAAELRREEAWKRWRAQTRATVIRYRRPAAWTSAAVIVAMLSVYFGRSSTSLETLSSLRTAMINVKSHGILFSIRRHLF